MLKNIAPLLAVMDVSIILKQHSDGTDITALIIPRPRKKAKNEKLNNFPPLVRRGPVEKVEAELNGQALLSKLAEFRDLVAEDAAFNKAVEEAKAKDDKKEPAAKAPAKRGTKAAAPTEAAPKKDKDVVLLDKTIADLEAAIEAKNAESAQGKYRAAVSLFKTIKERDADLVAGYADKIRPMKERIESIGQQSLEL